MHIEIINMTANPLDTMVSAIDPEYLPLTHEKKMNIISKEFELGNNTIFEFVDIDIEYIGITRFLENRLLKICPQPFVCRSYEKIENRELRYPTEIRKIIEEKIGVDIYDSYIETILRVIGQTHNQSVMGEKIERYLRPEGFLTSGRFKTSLKNWILLSDIAKNLPKDDELNQFILKFKECVVNQPEIIMFLK